MNSDVHLSCDLKVSVYSWCWEEGFHILCHHVLNSYANEFQRLQGCRHKMRNVTNFYGTAESMAHTVYLGYILTPSF